MLLALWVGTARTTARRFACHTCVPCSYSCTLRSPPLTTATRLASYRSRPASPARLPTASAPRRACCCYQHGPVPPEATGRHARGPRSQRRARCGECPRLSRYVRPGLSGKFRAIGKLFLGGRKNTSHAYFLYIGRRIYVFSHHLWLADPPHGLAWAASGKRLRRARPGKRIPASGPRQARSMRIYFGSIRAASVADISLAGAQFVSAAEFLGRGEILALERGYFAGRREARSSAR